MRTFLKWMRIIYHLIYNVIAWLDSTIFDVLPTQDTIEKANNAFDDLFYKEKKEKKEDK